MDYSTAHQKHPYLEHKSNQSLPDSMFSMGSMSSKDLALFPHNYPQNFQSGKNFSNVYDINDRNKSKEIHKLNGLMKSNQVTSKRVKDSNNRNITNQPKR